SEWPYFFSTTGAVSSPHTILRAWSALSVQEKFASLLLIQFLPPPIQLARIQILFIPYELRSIRIIPLAINYFFHCNSSLIIDLFLAAIVAPSGPAPGGGVESVLINLSVPPPARAASPYWDSLGCRFVAPPAPPVSSSYRGNRTARYSVQAPT